MPAKLVYGATAAAGHPRNENSRRWDITWSCASSGRALEWPGTSQRLNLQGV